MGIPKLQEFFLPVLKSIASSDVSSIRKVEEDIRKHFNLTEEQMSKRVPNNTKTEVYDKVTWAMTHLFKAGFIDKKGRGRRSITQHGYHFLETKPNSLTWEDLRRSFQNPTTMPLTAPSGYSVADQPPIEVLKETFEKLKNDILDELLNKVKKIHPRSFEELVLKLLRKMGYGEGERNLQHTGGPGDEGVDGVIFQDTLGCDRIYIQAKRYTATSVGRPEIQKFQGALSGKNSEKGIFITTSQFSKEARDYSKQVSSNLILIDGKKLTELLYQYDVGVEIEDVFEYKTVDDGFFEDN